MSNKKVEIDLKGIIEYIKLNNATLRDTANAFGISYVTLYRRLANENDKEIIKIFKNNKVKTKSNLKQYNGGQNER